MCYRVVISALELIEPCLGVVVVASVAQRVDLRHCACGGEDVAPCVVDVGGHFLILKAGDVPNHLHHIALQIQHIAVSLSGSGAVFVNQRKGSAGFVVNEIQDLRRAAAANRFSHDLAVLRDIGMGRGAAAYCDLLGFPDAISVVDVGCGFPRLQHSRSA